MFSRRIQQRASILVALLIKPFAQLGVTPNTLTVVGLLLSVMTAVVIAAGHLVAGGLLVLFAGIFDMFDGAMARVNNTATTFGAFSTRRLTAIRKVLSCWDCSCMHCSDQVYVTLLAICARANLDDRTHFIAMVGSLMVSYTKARAEGLGLECKTGLLARPERVVILAIGLLSGTSIWAVTLLAILSQATAIERIVYVRHITKPHVQLSQGSKASPRCACPQERYECR